MAHEVTRDSLHGGTQLVAYNLGELFDTYWMPDLGATSAADLLGWARAHVNWREIAEGMIEAVGESRFGWDEPTD